MISLAVAPTSRGIMKVQTSLILIFITWLVGFVAIAASVGFGYPLWYMFAITLGVSAGACTDPAILLLAIIAGSAAHSPKTAMLYALIISLFVSIYINNYGLIPEKGISVKAFSGRAIAAITISILSHTATTYLKRRKHSG